LLLLDIAFNFMRRLLPIQIQSVGYICSHFFLSLVFNPVKHYNYAQVFIVSLTEKTVSIPKTIWLFLLRKIYVVYSMIYIENIHKAS